MNNPFVGIEEFSQNWSNTISLFNGIASILIAWLIFCKEQRISLDKSRQFFLSVLDEVGIQLSLMSQFSESLSSATTEMERVGWGEICNNKNILSFLLALYVLEKKVHITRYCPSFRKFHSYDGLFDEYRGKKISLLRYGKKIDVDVFRSYLNDFENSMKKCLCFQEQMSHLFPNFSVFFNDEPSKVNSLIEIINECSTEEIFLSEIIQRVHEYTPDWSKAKKIGEGTKQYAIACEEIYISAENMLRGFFCMYDTNISLLYTRSSTLSKRGFYE